MALSGRPRFPGFRDDEYTSTLMLRPTLDYVRRSTVDDMAGTVTEIPMEYISGWPGRNTADAVLGGPSRLRRRARKKAAPSTLPPLQFRVVE